MRTFNQNKMQLNINNINGFAIKLIKYIQIIHNNNILRPFMIWICTRIMCKNIIKNVKSKPFLNKTEKAKASLDKMSDKVTCYFEHIQIILSKSCHLA